MADEFGIECQDCDCEDCECACHRATAAIPPEVKALVRKCKEACTLSDEEERRELEHEIGALYGAIPAAVRKRCEDD